MKSSRFPIFIVFVLLALLGLLAFLQYRWLGQVSAGEHRRLQARLESDTKRFSEDFNREIQNAYFNFQFPAKIWQEKNRTEFNNHLDFWKSKTDYPELIKNFYFIEAKDKTVSVYNRQTQTFEPANWTENLNKIKPEIENEENFQPLADEVPAMIIPVYEQTEKTTRIIIRTKNTEDIKGLSPESENKYGFLIIELDEKIIAEKILPNLAKKYFSESEGENYNVGVFNRENIPVFQTQNLTAADAAAKLFDLSPDRFIFYGTPDTKPNASSPEIVVSETKKIIRQNLPNETTKKVDIQVAGNGLPNAKPIINIFEGDDLNGKGIWTLRVQNTEGSVEQFITNARRKNLAISFGILGILGASLLLIYVSVRRAQTLAQKQMNFVSAVSHEFRTPLAVLLSAGENLSDGVIRDQAKIADYGNLIKREGRKLSAMVEQILEFAGAKSGKKNYRFAETEIGEIVENALGSCQSLIEENNFTIEQIFGENLPKITADKSALSRALQNLIVNSIKYDKGEKFIRISARNGDGTIKIAVEDRGIGIAEKDLAQIFKPFYRSKSVVDSQISGNGLGLSILKQTVEAHGGKILSESKIGEGSKFTIILPLEN